MKVIVTVKVSCWVLHAQQTEQRLVVLHILALATYAVSNFRCSSEGMHCTSVTLASQPLSTSTAPCLHVQFMSHRLAILQLSEHLVVTTCSDK